MSTNEWWKICPICQGCEQTDECDEPCAMAMSFLSGGCNG